ncbi:MAG: ammonium transporter, partial [Kiloniellaceae bacterium]
MRVSGKFIALTGGALALLAAAPAQAAVSDEARFVFNTFSFLVHGFLVMWMAAGFAMLESGLVRTKNTATICLKNIALYSVAGILYYLIGYSLMYVDVDRYIGAFSLLYNPSEAELALINAEEATEALIAPVVGNGYAVMSDWFFQMVFVATAASIVSGTLAERIKVWPFLIFIAVLTGLIYPIEGAWTWGGGWLGKLGFSDFAGSTVVHSVGGWAALSGAIILGARKGKYGPDGKVNALPGANLPLATLGTFILWFGWFGFNGGSQLALGSALDAAAMAIVYVNTNLAAAAGVIAAMAATQLVYRKIDLTMALNGAIAGLVSITAGPDLQNHLLAIVVGAIGGVLVVFAIPLLDRLRIDDVVGA